MARRRPPTGTGAALLLIIAAGAALRFVGLSWGLPYDLHPDEPIIVAAAERMSWSEPNPGFFIYPGLFIYQVFVVSRVVYALGGAYADVIWAARLLTALYGVATILFVYLLGARLGGRRFGLMAAALVAGMGTLALHAHYAVTDTPATALATATLWLSVRGWQRRSFAGLLGAALVAGLAVSTKYSAAPVCVAPWIGGMAMVASARGSWQRYATVTASLAGAALLAFLLTSPYTLLDARGFLRDMGIESELQAESRPGRHIDPLEEPTLADRGLVGNARAMADDLSLATLVIALGGLLHILSRAPAAGRALHRDEAPPPARAEHPALTVTDEEGRDATVSNGDGFSAADAGPSTTGEAENFPADTIAAVMVAAWVVLYYLLMAPSAIAGQRYVLPIYPAIMLLAALTIEGVIRVYTERGRARVAWAAGIVLFVIVAGPSFAHAADTVALARRDTRLEARDWILANIAPGSHLAREFYAPPLHSGDGYRLSQPFSLTDHPLATYCAEGVEYLLLSSLNRDRYFEDDGERFADERSWYARLDDRTRLVHRVEGIEDLDLHHPTIEVRRLFCGPAEL